MKKAAMSILAAAITLIFTACGVSQSKYDRVVEELDYLRLENKRLELEKSGGGTETSDSENDEKSGNIAMKVGDVIAFGGYDWQVLDIQDGKALILSVRVLTNQPYNSIEASVTWENSSIRGYLNQTFYHGVFSAEEKLRIAETRISNKANPWYGKTSTGGVDTLDKVFLLSLEEVAKYFGDSGLLGQPPEDESILELDDEYNSERVAYGMGQSATWWWLRSPGGSNLTAVFVRSEGIISVAGGVVEFLPSASGGNVRPALWLILE
ncbi:MAG: DUF6273 domain-containing protein [Oscillospiraceae bacterium]|nr:DUF6273 domain-containing protein [Oscillospiraceae bacterium]